MEQEKILTANDYIKKAEECEKYKEFTTAMKYFQKAYELDPRMKAAQGGVERMEKEIANQIFFLFGNNNTDVYEEVCYF